MEIQLARKHVLWVLINLICLSGYESCLEEERLGLLSIRDYFELNGVRTGQVFPSWNDDLASDCCRWERVKCNSTTGRVIELFLNNTSLDPDNYYPPERPLFLNVSLFLPFEELHNLHLNQNWFTDCYQNHGFEKIFVLKKLEVLDLTKNNFQNNILQSLGEITSLRSLNLSKNNFERFFPVKELKAIKHLETLDLSYNDLSDPPKVQDFKSLENLIVLNLKANSFNSSILSFISTLTSLTTLNLGWNNLEASVSAIGIFNRLSRLQKLEVLNLKGNDIMKSNLKSLGAVTSLKNLCLAYCGLDGVFPAQDLTNLKNLEILDLSGNNLNGSLADLNPMTSLKSLSLAENNFNGSLAQEGLCALKDLQELDLSYNNLSGIIPSCLGKLTSLRLIDLSSNKLEGDISSFPIAALKSLEYINLRNNLFWGQFSFYSIANHTNLEVLILSSDNHKLEVQTHYSYDWLPTFQLQVIVMSNCRLNNIPHFLTHQIDLRVVDVSHNNLTGTFPNWLLENNTQFEFLNLRNNSFVGSFHLPSNFSFAMRQIDISDNYFHGKLQQNIGGIIPHVEAFNLSVNAFDGGIPSSIANMPYLLSLDLSNNKFSGGIPSTLLTNSSNVEYLLLSNNGLKGEVPKTKSNKTSLRSLQLGGNRFTGTLSNWISHYPSLEFLDISGNFISGEIPGFIGNLSLFVLNMADNELEGTFPCELSVSRLFFLDISHNNLSGIIPSCLNWSTDLQHLNMEGNRFTGTIPKTLSKSFYMMTLNIGNNFLSGEIPTSIGNLSYLRVLHLGGNNLSGLLPGELCQLNELNILDLSHNSFSGPIPSCLSRISFGKVSTPNLAQSILGFVVPFGLSYNFLDNLKTQNFSLEDITASSVQQVHVEFVTKTISRIYSGSILGLMSGLDLSSNKLSGEMPEEIGNLSSIRALNLSHNQLTGSIPRTWGNLSQIESLDLSYNKLSGDIPSDLINLNFLEVFNVSYNHLSGRLPALRGQFATFDNTSYEGNPFLCGPPLDTNCSTDLPELPPSSDESNRKWHDIVDPVSFLASFVATYLVHIWAFVAVLCVSPYWRRRWFMFIENFLDYCHFMVFYTIPKLFSRIVRKPYFG